jgi:hypothetical protein
MSTEEIQNDPLTEAKPKINKNKKYTDIFYEKHKNDKTECKICNVSVNKFNFSHHTKTEKHLKNMKKEEEKNKHIEIFNKRIELLNEMKVDEKTYFIMKQLLS